MISTINNVISTIFFIILILSSSSDRPLILILFLASNILLMVRQLYYMDRQSYWELQKEEANKAIMTGLLYILISFILGVELTMYLGLFTIGQSIMTRLFFGIYSRII